VCGRRSRRAGRPGMGGQCVVDLPLEHRELSLELCNAGGPNVAASPAGTAAVPGSLSPLELAPGSLPSNTLRCCATAAGCFHPWPPHPCEALTDHQTATTAAARSTTRTCTGSLTQPASCHPSQVGGAGVGRGIAGRPPVGCVRVADRYAAPAASPVLAGASGGVCWWLYWPLNVAGRGRHGDWGTM
jgi:hypothetical protein